MKPERNKPCPCGSGKKFKKCCGASMGNYADALMAECERSVASGAKGLQHINVMHDDDCALLAKTGPCDCTPTVSEAVSHDHWKRRN